MIYLNDIPIPVEENFSVRVVTINPACFHNNIVSDAGLGISIPVNEHSRAIFGNPEQFDKHGSGADRTFSGFEVRPKGVLVISGNLIITSANDETYEGWVQSNLGAMGDEQREKFINELEWPAGETFTNKSAYTYPTDDYSLVRVNNPAFWEGKGRQEDVEIVYYDDNGIQKTKTETMEFLSKKFWDNAFYWVNQKEGAGTLKVEEGCVVSPYLWLKYVVSEMFKQTGWYIERNDYDDNSELDGLMLYNNFNIMKAALTTSQKTVYQYDETGAEIIGVTITAITDVTWSLDVVNYADLIPRVNIGEWILGLQNYLNYIFFFRGQNRVDIIDRNAIPNSTAIDLDAYFVGEWSMGDRKNVTLKFFAQYEKNDGLQGDDWHDLSDRRHDFAEAVQTYDDLENIVSPAIGELRLVTTENKIYEYGWSVHVGEDQFRNEHHNDMLGWDFVSTGPQPFLYGDADEHEEIKTAFSTLVQTLISEYGCSTKHPGNVRHMRSLWKDFSPRLMFAHPFFPGVARDTNGTVNLNWDGETGLFEKRWKNWARFWKNRLPVEGRFDLPLNVIDYVKNNIHRKFRTRHGEFIIEEMETEFGLEKTWITRIKGYKI